MATRERDYTIDDVWRMASANEGNRYTLIDGELFVTMSPGQLHGGLAGEIARLLGNFVVERALGRVTVEAGYHPPGNRRTLLLPDVAFEGLPRAAQPARLGFVPYMPDLAVEIISPSQDWEDMRAKAEIYLRHGTSLVWLIYPERAKRRDVDQRDRQLAAKRDRRCGRRIKRRGSPARFQPAATTLVPRLSTHFNEAAYSRSTASSSSL